MIEILMGTFNGSAFLEEQLNSIINQTYSDWILTIRDDGSLDGTVDIINKYVNQYPEKINIIVDGIATGSAKKNFIKLIKCATKEYVMFCDQDDIWLPNKIEDTYNEMVKIEKIKSTDIPILIHTDLIVVDEDLNVMDNSFINYMNLPIEKGINDVIIQNSITGCTVMVNTKLLEILKHIDEESPILMHDHVAAIIASAYGSLQFLNKGTIKYRQHDKNSVGANNARSVKYKLGRYRRGREEFRKDMLNSYKQVEYILSVCNELKCDKQVLDMLGKYSELDKENKFNKIKFYIKYKVYKKGNTRRIVQFLWT